MALALAPPARRRLSWRPVGRVWLEVPALATMEEPSRLVRRITAAVVACGVAIPAVAVWRIAVNAPDELPAALAAMAVLVPAQVWLILAASRGRTTARHRWVLAGVLAVVLGLLPVVGFNWLGAFYPLSALVLVIVPRPYGLPLFAVVSALPAPLALALDEPRWASYFAIGTLMYGMSVAVPIWLITAIRDLEAARHRLAEDAVIGERLRIDDELRRSVGRELAAIVDVAERVADDPEPRLRDLVDRSRTALARARVLVRRYRTVPLRAELRTAAALLSAAGIRLELPPDPMSDPAAETAVDEEQRSTLRADVARLLSEAPAGAARLTRAGGALRITQRRADRTGVPS